MMIAYPALIAFLCALVFTPLARRIALRVGLVDKADGHRKLQSNAVPMGGGVAMWCAFALTICLIAVFHLSFAQQILNRPLFTVGLLGSSAIICFVGLLDDKFDLRGRQKLLAQVLSTLMIVQAGLKIDSFEIFGYRAELGLLAVPFTVLWLLGAINALNLIDGIDGLAGTVSVILSVTIAVLCGMTGRVGDALIAWTLAGSVAGFLVFNLPPARIYMGDAGSMLVGLILGVLAIRSSIKGAATVALAAPTAIWAILVFDVLMAILRRTLTGRSIYTTDRSHLHHVLQKRGFTVPFVLLIIGALCLICSVGGLISVALHSELIALGVSASVLAMLVVTGFFGGSECLLLARRFQNLASSTLRLPNATRAPSLPVCSRFHGNREWERLWDSLVDYADRFDLCSLQLNVSSPTIGEEYHAVWKRNDSLPLIRVWRTEIPLLRRELCVGRLTVSGEVREGEVVTWMSELIEGLKPFELQLTSLLEETPVVTGSSFNQRTELRHSFEPVATNEVATASKL